MEYFQDFFTSLNPQDFEEFFSEVPRLITDQMNEELTVIATEEEVWKVLFIIHPEKALGPDGMTALFFQRLWQVIKSDLVGMLTNFLTTFTFDQRLNMTNICLIPEMERSTKMTEFRIISLCNVGYKIISKIIGQRLKKILPNLISETQ